VPNWRRARKPAPDAVGPETLAAVRAAITDLLRRRDRARAAAGGALVHQAQVRRAVAEQRLELQAAVTHLDEAVRLAGEVADRTATEDGEVAAAPFRNNVEGLERQRDVLAQAVAQLDGLDETSELHVAAARAVLVRTQEQFDAALREHLSALTMLERAERDRIVRAARARHDGN
jgi:hypothetical protein